MTISETFQANAGYQLIFEGKSILLQMTAVGKRLSRRSRADMAATTANFLSDIGNKPNLRPGAAREVHAGDFPEARGEAYKIVTPATEAYLRRGSFRLGSPTYYANLGTDPRTDGWEGYTSVFVDFQGGTFVTAVTTGYNCLAFCTTRARDRSRLRQLREKFGGPEGRVIKITDVDGFARLLAERVAGANCSVRDVRYSDTKLIHLAAERYAILGDLLMSTPPPHNLTPDVLRKLNETFAPTIHRDALLSSLFVKPLAYAAEQERRLVVELPADVPPPHYIDIVAPESLRFLEFET